MLGTLSGDFVVIHVLRLPAHYPARNSVVAPNTVHLHVCMPLLASLLHDLLGHNTQKTEVYFSEPWVLNTRYLQRPFSSNLLFDSCTTRWCLQALSTAMTVHHEVLRAQLNKYKGVEMQIDGDAVLLGFRDPVSAIAWCLATQQVCLLSTPKCMPSLLCKACARTTSVNA